MKLISVLILSALTGCATQTSHSESEKIALHDAQVKEIECGLKHVSEIDDHISDASTVALALSYRCADDYQNVTEVSGALLDNDRQREMFRSRRSDKEHRVSDFLQIVMASRNQKK